MLVDARTALAGYHVPGGRDLDEADRIAALRRHNILDTVPEPAFDRVVAHVRALCRVPIALVSLVDRDRQWFKAREGVAIDQTPIDTSVCALAIRQSDVFEIDNLAADPRTARMSLVAGEPFLRFYAGAPIVTSDGAALGSLCAIDVAARPGGLNEDQRIGLAALADQVAAMIELRSAVLTREHALANDEELLRRERATQAALAASQEKLELATRSAQLGHFDYFPQTGALDWDDRCRQLFGLSPGVTVSYEGSYLAGLHPDDRERGAERVLAALDPAGSRTFDVEYRTIGIEDGVERHIHAQGTALFDGDTPLRLVGTVRDVTANRLAAATLRQTEERLRLAGRATNDAVWDWDLLLDHVTWNEAMARSYGHALIDVEPTGAWWLEHIHPDDRARIDHSIHAVIDSDDIDWTDEYRFRRKDGSYADILDRGYVIRDEDRRAVRMIGAMLDQSERKGVERGLERMASGLAEQVEQGKAEIERLWSASPDLLVVMDRDGRYLRTNPVWKTILGYEANDIDGLIATDLALEDDGRTLAALKVAQQGQLDPFENRFRRKDGGYRWISWVAAPSGDEIFAIGRDISAEVEARELLRQTEDALRQSQKVEAIGQLTGGVAHDFNNLLTVIRGSADLLRRPGLTEEKRRRYVDAIADTADRATRLTSQLLAFARRSPLEPKAFDAREQLTALMPIIQTLAGSRVELVGALGEEPRWVSTDPSLFDTAIINMAVNARDAMAGQGIFTIRLEAIEQRPAIRHHAPVDGPQVAVSVVDTGTGIARDKIEHIFEPFFTTKEAGHGTGLGLSQVFGFAKQSRGEIGVSSEIGQGTTFTLYLPEVDAIETPAAPPVNPSRLRENSCILVVEDNREVGEFATAALAELGHRSLWRTNADEALAELAKGHDQFDIVFTDVVMPGRSGIELAEELRRLYPTLPVVLASGYSDVLAEHGSSGLALLHKPYSIEELSRALESASSR